MLDFQEIDQTPIAIVGGKGAHLGELSRISGVNGTDGYVEILPTKGCLINLDLTSA